MKKRLSVLIFSGVVLTGCSSSVVTEKEYDTNTVIRNCGKVKLFESEL